MSNSSPVISFCISTYQRPDILRSTLLCLQKQSFLDFEVIVSDNDPNESGRLAFHNFQDSRLKYFSNNGNLGMKKSFNKSVERSIGEFIVMMADDDPVYPDMLETLIELKNKYPGYGMYLGGCDWFCVDHKLAKLYSLKVGTNTCLSNDYDLNYTTAFSGEEFVEVLFNFKIFPHYLWSTCIVKRDIIIEMGGIPDYGTPFLGDYAYLSIMGSHSGCAIINKSLGCQTLHKENFGRNQNDQLIILARNFPEYLASKISTLRNWTSVKFQISNFVSLYLVSHLSFLRTYPGVDKQSLKKAENDIFSLDYMRKYRLKYFLKTRYPYIHNSIVSIKKGLKK